MTNSRCLAVGPRGAVCERIEHHPGSHHGYTDDERLLIAWRDGETGFQAQGGPRE